MNASRIPPATVSANHTLRRAWERYGVVLTVMDLAHIANRISDRDSSATLACPTHRAGEVWAVRYRGVLMYVVYSPLKNKVLTFLDEAMAARRRPPERPECKPSKRRHLTERARAFDDVDEVAR